MKRDFTFYDFCEIESLAERLCGSVYLLAERNSDNYRSAQNLSFIVSTLRLCSALARENNPHALDRVRELFAELNERGQQ